MKGRKQTLPPCGAVIVAAGASRRMAGVDKIMAQLQGEAVLIHTIRAFEQAGCITEIVVVTREDLRQKVEEMIREKGFLKVTAVTPGGNTRAVSVQRGLERLSRKIELAAVHDGARPLVTGDVIEGAVRRAAQCHAAAPCVPLKDTVKETDDDGRVTHTPDRAKLRAVQTPQVFQRDLLLAAWEKARLAEAAYTDDCGAMEAMGVPVYLTEGSEENIKITTQLDIHLAELILAGRQQT